MAMPTITNPTGRLWGRALVDEQWRPAYEGPVGYFVSPARELPWRAGTRAERDSFQVRLDQRMVGAIGNDALFAPVPSIADELTIREPWMANNPMLTCHGTARLLVERLDHLSSWVRSEAPLHFGLAEEVEYQLAAGGPRSTSPAPERVSLVWATLTGTGRSTGPPGNAPPRSPPRAWRPQQATRRATSWTRSQPTRRTSTPVTSTPGGTPHSAAHRQVHGRSPRPVGPGSTLQRARSSNPASRRSSSSSCAQKRAGRRPSAATRG